MSLSDGVARRSDDALATHRRADQHRCTRSFEGTAQARTSRAWTSQPCLILVALLVVTSCSGILYESPDPSAHDHLDAAVGAGVGAMLALKLSGNESRIIAMIGSCG